MGGSGCKGGGAVAVTVNAVPGPPDHTPPLPCTARYAVHVPSAALVGAVHTAENVTLELDAIVCGGMTSA